MNMWNRDFVHDHYPAQIRDWLVEGQDSALSVRSAERPLIMGQKVVNDDSDFGWAATWASEMGDHETLSGLLRHADRYMAPAWRDGGFYFPRNDTMHDAEGNRTLVEPMCGNVLMGYASLNVPNGLWKLYNEPMSVQERRQPALVEVGDGVDVLRAYFDPKTQQLHFTLRRCASARAGFEVVIGRLAERARWTLSMGGIELAEGIGATVAATSLPGLREGDMGVLFDCSRVIDATLFVLELQTRGATPPQSRR